MPLTLTLWSQNQ